MSPALGAIQGKRCHISLPLYSQLTHRFHRFHRYRFHCYGCLIVCTFCFRTNGSLFCFHYLLIRLLLPSLGLGNRVIIASIQHPYKFSRILFFTRPPNSPPLYSLRDPPLHLHGLCTHPTHQSPWSTTTHCPLSVSANLLDSGFILLHSCGERVCLRATT